MKVDNNDNDGGDDSNITDNCRICTEKAPETF
jgi:hypothetical protein